MVNPRVMQFARNTEFSYVKKDLYEVVGCRIVGSLILWTMHGTSI